METYRKIIDKVISDYIKNPNHHTQDLLSKRFMEWTWLWDKSIYEELDVSEEIADHYDILTSYFLDTMTDWEIELTANCILEQGTDNIL